MTSVGKIISISNMNKMIKDLDEFEAKLCSVLRASGHLFPTTDREIEHFLEQTEPVTLPEKYQTPDFIFEEDVHALVKRTSINTVDFSGIARNWAFAARNGKNLPQSILDKMKEDKKKSQKK